MGIIVYSINYGYNAGFISSTAVHPKPAVPEPLSDNQLGFGAAYGVIIQGQEGINVSCSYSYLTYKHTEN